MVSGAGGGLLEIDQAEGAFARIEAFLREAGFFAPPVQASDDTTAEARREAPARRAELYLGYALSDPLRRSGLAAPPEPAALPLAACRVIEGPPVPAAPGGYAIGAWARTWEAGEHARAVQAAREAIAEGEVYQVNLVQHLCAPFSGDPAGAASALERFAPLHGRPFEGDGWTVVSASPELFLARQGRRAWTMPIKGTRPRGGGAELRRSVKDAAEHAMIVDLERNDLGRICEPDSVAWPERMQARSMAGVEHLVSRVEGTLRRDVGFTAILEAMFPGGSVTGAPKIAALDHIASLEPVGRGASMGALGTVWPSGDFELTLTIRTFAIVDDRIHLWVGGGVVWDSDPWAEVEESWVKARPLLTALGAPADAAPAPDAVAAHAA